MVEPNVTMLRNLVSTLEKNGTFADGKPDAGGQSLWCASGAV